MDILKNVPSLILWFRYFFLRPGSLVALASSVQIVEVERDDPAEGMAGDEERGRLVKGL